MIFSSRRRQRHCRKAAATFVNAIVTWQQVGVEQPNATQRQSISGNGKGGWYVVADAHDAAAKQRATALLKEIEPNITETEIASCLGGGTVPVGREFSLDAANALMRGLQFAGIGARKYRAV